MKMSAPTESIALEIHKIDWTYYASKPVRTEWSWRSEKSSILSSPDFSALPREQLLRQG